MFKLLVCVCVLNRMPYVRGKMFDIQFTYNRLTVKMEHRACERIASVTRPEMRQVLFPQQDSLLQRAQIDSQIRWVIVQQD